MSGVAKPSVGRRIFRGILWGLLLLFLAVLFLSLTGGRTAYIIEIPFHFICGWALHGWKALPPFSEKWEAALLPAGCILLAGVLLHRFIRRWAKEKRPSLEWRAKHTAAVMSLILLCSASAIATSGIVHQFFWLAGGKVIEDNRRTEMTVAMSNGRQLMMLLLEFYDKNGRYPHSFDELETEFESAYGGSRKLWWVETGDGGIPEPFVLLRPGSDAIALDEEPLIVSPVLREGRMVLVGYGDTSVRMLPTSRLEEMMKIHVRVQ